MDKVPKRRGRHRIGFKQVSNTNNSRGGRKQKMAQEFAGASGEKEDGSSAGATTSIGSGCLGAPPNNPRGGRTQNMTQGSLAPKACRIEDKAAGKNAGTTC